MSAQMYICELPEANHLSPKNNGMSENIYNSSYAKAKQRD